MSTATAPNPAPSALLRRGAPALVPIAPPHELHVTLIGELLEPAQSCIEAATGRAALSVVVGQGYGLPAVLATLWLGDGYDAMQHAAERAAKLPRGAVVAVHGDQLRMRYHHGALAVVLGTVRRIEPLPHHARGCGAAAQEVAP